MGILRLKHFEGETAYNNTFLHAKDRAVEGGKKTPTPLAWNTSQGI